MALRRTDKPKGLLRVGAPKGIFDHARLLPSPDLAFFVEHYWIVAWDLGENESLAQEMLPYPSIHVAIERGRSGIYGIVRGAHFINDFKTMVGRAPAEYAGSIGDGLR